jgi:hypothetical protein
MYVSIKASVKEVFDTAHKAAALKALDDSIRAAVDANKSFTTKKPDKLSIVLTATVAVSADDKAKPSKLKATLSIDGLLTGGTAQAFKATGNGAMDGLNPKKLELDVTDLVKSVVSDLMKNKVLPQMLKMAP